MPIQELGHKKESIGARLSQGLSRSLDIGSQLANRHIDKQKEIDTYNKLGIDPSIVDIPEQYKDYFVKQAMSNKTQNVNYGMGKDRNKPPRENPQEFLNENRYESREMPEFGGIQKMSRTGGQLKQPNENNQGNLLNPALEEGRIGVLSPDEVIAEGKRIASEQSQNGIPTTVYEGIQLAREMNNARKEHNIGIESEAATKIAQQRDYGDKAVQKLKKVMENPTDEQMALFKRKGEQYASQNKSEAEIERLLSADARQFKNTIANIKNSVGPRRTFTNLKEDILGTSRSAEKIRDDINIKLQPLLKEGLYDSARNLLSELGYYPEERESLITKLGEGSLKSLAELSDFSPEGISNDYRAKKYGPSYGSFVTPEQKERVKDNMRNVFRTDPGTNLILLRKGYEDKNVDWQTFKDNLNELIENGEIELTPDQFNALDHLEKPPLNNLEKILHGLKIIGR